MGDLYGYKVRYAVEEWQEKKSLPDLVEVENALIDADHALAWEGDNPQYHELKARVLYYKALLQGLDAEAMEYVSQAKALHQKAIKLRPHWPYSWANLALMKSYLEEWDTEYNTALMNAVKYGPWEQSVHLTIAHAGAMSWAKLTAEQKRVVAANVERGIARNFQAIALNLDAYNKRTLVCAYMTRNDRQKKFCKTVPATVKR
ncbi:MAG: hypothetical protein CSA60_00570 [Neptuniibacter caesariensis]|uniref:Uncharacterized protein n=1 Tax=Neptuniibacter caesariensis TaxID=207954 RepID=A0A2G6JPU1_NEPCE|nr:MAG: hypothetical protein CSA60_00570 [Neptuniibacter caesariensis]